MRRLTTGQGNEHITVKHPDGREEHTINGVEQDPPTVPPSRYLGPSAYPAMHRDPRRSNTAPAPGPTPQPIAYHTPPPPYASRSVYDPPDRHHRHGNGPSCFSLSSLLYLLLTWPSVSSSWAIKKDTRSFPQTLLDMTTIRFRSGGGPGPGDSCRRTPFFFCHLLVPFSWGPSVPMYPRFLLMYRLQLSRSVPFFRLYLRKCTMIHTIAKIAITRKPYLHQ